MKARLFAATVVAAVALLSVPGAGQGIEVPLPNLEAPIFARLKRKPIPVGERVPAALHISGRISNRDMSPVPELREVEIEADRGGAIDVEGIPGCGRNELPKGPPPAKRCAEAIVGRGEATVVAAFPESVPMNIRTELIVYNAGVRNGETGLWISASLSPLEKGRVFVPVRIRKLAFGRYGWKAVATLPRLLEGHGSITELHLTLQRRIISARCPTDHLAAKIRSSFEDGTLLQATSIQICR